MMWLIAPITALIALPPDQVFRRRATFLAWLTFAASILTQLIYPLFYMKLVSDPSQLLPIFCLVSRNLLLLLITALLCLWTIDSWLHDRRARLAPRRSTDPDETASESGLGSCEQAEEGLSKDLAHRDLNPPVSAPTGSHG